MRIFHPLVVAIVIALGATTSRAQHLEVPARILPFAAGWSGGGSDVAVGTDGEVLVTWEEIFLDNHTPLPHELVVQRLAPDLTPRAGSFRSRISSHVDPSLPRIAADPAGGYALSWTGGKVGTDVTAMSWRLDPTGAPFSAVAAVDVTDNNQSTAVGTKVIVLADRTAIVAWVDSFATLGRRVDRFGIPLGNPFLLFSTSAFVPFELAALPGGGFAALQSLAGTLTLRVFEDDGTPRGVEVDVGTNLGLSRLAVRPFGDLLAAVGVRPGEAIALIRFTSTGTIVDEQTVQGAFAGSVAPSVAFDVNGSILVTWWEQLFGTSTLRGRGFDPAGAPIGPPVSLETVFGTAVNVHTARSADGLGFVNAWSSRTGGATSVDLVSLCTPGTTVCGDGTLDPLCERCDDGGANSDVTADACRSDCRPARCGDGAIDSGEGCDDGNTEACDGCDSVCMPEVGRGCGDGIPYPSCGETCDDGNFLDRDGCAANCTLERIPGGGSPATDCLAAWSVNDPSNLPYLDKHGTVSQLQRCTDGDSACDFDAAAGTCTFHVRVCANNRDFAACTPSPRLASWELFAPSANAAAHAPALAAVRAALLTAPGTIVGPGDPDVCTPFLALPVPLRGSPGSYRPGKLKLKARAAGYDGRRDLDVLRLVCDPAVP